MVKAMYVVKGPWKFKIKVMAKVKPIGHVWCIELNR